MGSVKNPQFPPLKTNPNIWTFLLQVTSDIKKKKYFSALRDNNNTLEQQQAINQLQNNRDITIKMVDKGRNVVVMDTKRYLEMCPDILSNRDALISEEKIQEFNE